jgi:hypothetical protein
MAITAAGDEPQLEPEIGGVECGKPDHRRGQLPGRPAIVSPQIPEGTGGITTAGAETVQIGGLRSWPAKSLLSCQVVRRARDLAGAGLPVVE